MKQACEKLFASRESYVKIATLSFRLQQMGGTTTSSSPQQNKKSGCYPDFSIIQIDPSGGYFDQLSIFRIPYASGLVNLILNFL